MRYLLQIYMTEDGSVWERLSEDEKSAELAARVPAARMGGAVEVRPLVEP